MSNSRAVTLNGINEIFSVIDVEIKKHEMGYYYTSLNGKELQGKTLVAIGQKILTELSGSKNLFTPIESPKISGDLSKDPAIAKILAPETTNEAQ